MSRDINYINEIKEEDSAFKNQIFFSTFGCWNRGCITDSGQDYVTRMLKNNESKYDFLVILGDNYYPNKLKLEIDTGKTDKNGNSKIIEIKKKDIKLNEIKRGFDCLNKINLDKKLIMGNHDIDDAINQSCSILKQQLKLPWYDVKFPFDYEIHTILTSDGKNYEDILFLYIDTNIYSQKNEENCYRETLNSIYNSIEDLKMRQNSFIKEKINEFRIKENINKIIIFGHEPLLMVKEKKKNLKDGFIYDLTKLLFDILIENNNLNITYICADYHIYQNTKIKYNGFEITQLIFGTGGAELDDPPILSLLFDYNSNLLKDNNIGLDLERHYIIEFNKQIKKKVECISDFEIGIDLDNLLILEILDNIVYDNNNNNISENYNNVLGVKNYGYGEIIIDNEKIEHKFINITKFVQIENIKYNDIQSFFSKKYIKYKQKYLSNKSILN